MKSNYGQPLGYREAFCFVAVNMRRFQDYVEISPDLTLYNPITVKVAGRF
jgi:hypothetical protein